MRSLVVFTCLLVACGSTNDETEPAADASSSSEVSTDASSEVDVATDTWDGSIGALLEGTCAKSTDLGAAFTDGFGRADGVVVALVPPTVECEASHNSTHLTIELKIAGKIQRLVVTMKSTKGDPNLRFATTNHALLGPAWSDGWHLGTNVDYVTDLGLEAKDFTTLDMTTLTARVTASIDVGDHVSVFATAEGRPESAHLVHRSTTVPGHDGAVIVRPESTAPQWLLFHFEDQDAQFP